MPKETIEEVEEPLEEAAAEEDLDDLEPTEADLEGPAAAPEPAAADPESLQQLLVKQEATEDDAAEDEDEPVLVTTSSSTEDRAEPLDTRVVPMQASEFVCSNCFLVKHRSQLADKKKMRCRDCA